MEVTTREPIHIKGTGKRVALLDLGVKYSIIRYLEMKNCDIYILPATSSYEDIISCRPDGILVSNGPGDPKDLPEVKLLLQRLIGKFPILGICLGHLLLGLALGGNTCKLKFGHHGANHPVRDYTTGRCYITSQSHNYVLEKETCRDVEITQVNVNDGTVEAFRHTLYPVLGVQYHPETAAGPGDANYIFDGFIETM
jgi:carbamoyl-phosphate synthase small subunit